MKKVGAKSVAAKIFASAMMLLAFSGAEAGRAPMPMEDFSKMEIHVGEKKLTADQVRKAIVVAGSKSGYPWTVVGESPGVLKMSTTVRGKHVVVVEVSYTPTSYGIKYVSSENMGYQGGLIHPNYNNWVRQFIRSINVELQN
jgi:hypothetical protein